ncbi:MAG: hypothetical protein WCE21_01750 [Candidatus Babeliales bacterium]
MEQIIMPTDTSKHHVSVRFQLFLMLLSMIILIFGAYRSSQSFDALDLKPEVLSISPADIKRFGGQPSNIKVGFVINDFSRFDIVKGEFELKGIIWFEFDPSVVSLAILEQFSFERAISIERSQPHAKIIDNKTIFVWYSIKVHIIQPLQYSGFPLDDHTLYFILNNNALNTNEVQFVAEPENFLIDIDMSMLGWDMVGKATVDGYIRTSLGSSDEYKVIERPVALFSVDFLHSSMRQSLSILLPLLLIFFLSLGAFSIDYVEYPESVLSLPIGGVTALLAYQFVIQSISPNVGYFMLSDIIFFVILAAIFCTFFFSIFVSEISVFFKKIFIVSMHAIVDSILLYLFLIWGV